MKRRSILKSAVVLPVLGSVLVSCTSGSEKELGGQQVSPAKALKILILGGTSFLGPHQIAEALGRGHSITTFTRGKTKPTIHQDLFDKVEMLIGDREDNLVAIEDGEWDVVIDNSGRNVKWTEATANLLKDRVGVYMYTSSTGVYYPYLGDGIREDTKLVEETPTELEFEWEKMEYDYGVMKTLSEKAAKAAFGEARVCVIRPTYMIGPGDMTDRFIYWPIRLAKGGEVLVPGKSEDPVQYIDVRDVAKFMIDQAEKEVGGVYNLVGPGETETMRVFVDKAAKAFDAKSTFVYIDDYDFLEKNGVPYLVPWIPPTGSNYGSSRVSNVAALDAGLQLRPVEVTVKDTYSWWTSGAITDSKRETYEANPKALLNTEKEIIKLWNSQ